MIKLLGHIVPDGKRLWLISSAAEVGFRVKGATRLLLRLKADDTVLNPAMEILRPRFEVRLDGKTILDARMSAKDAAVNVFEGAEKRDGEVQLIKLSEGTQSLIALQEILTDGKIEPLPDKPLKMEFIGDSITCGYGVEGKNETETFTTATENVTKGYAFLTAEALGADAVMTCFSGHGIISGYTSDPEVRNSSELVPPYYEKTGRNGFVLPSGRTVTDIDWDFSAWQPDDIIINLGTNDLSWCQEFPERKEKYRKMYVQFLKTVRKNNPHARMLCILGAMGEGLNEHMQAAVRDYIAETGDRHIRAVSLKEQNGLKNGYGANYHPSAITQQELAETVIRELRNH